MACTCRVREVGLTALAGARHGYKYLLPLLDPLRKHMPSKAGKGVFTAFSCYQVLFCCQIEINPDLRVPNLYESNIERAFPSKIHDKITLLSLRTVCTCGCTPFQTALSKLNLHSSLAGEKLQGTEGWRFIYPSTLQKELLSRTSANSGIDATASLSPFRLLRNNTRITHLLET